MSEGNAKVGRVVITRDLLRSGVLRQNLLKSGLPCLSEEDFARSFATTLARWDGVSDVWLFGYGSLMWNPAIHYAESRAALLRGYHRQFCLWVFMGRGTPDRPGLMLALQRGGSCHGVAFRLPAASVREELGIVWNREMLSGAYRPRWVRLETLEGEAHGLTFVVNRTHQRYAGRLAEDEVALRLACAGGNLGPCKEYLLSTARHLDELCIRDTYIERLARRVATLPDAGEDVLSPAIGAMVGTGK
jgi:cation transport protein ChaC